MNIPQNAIIRFQSGNLVVYETERPNYILFQGAAEFYWLDTALNVMGGYFESVQSATSNYYSTIEFVTAELKTKAETNNAVPYNKENDNVIHVDFRRKVRLTGAK